MRPEAEVDRSMIELKAVPGGCEEASILSRGFYIPCNRPAVNIVRWKGRTDRPIRMCFGCSDHNVRNRGGEIVEAFKAEVVR